MMDFLKDILQESSFKKKISGIVDSAINTSVDYKELEKNMLDEVEKARYSSKKSENEE